MTLLRQIVSPIVLVFAVVTIALAGALTVGWLFGRGSAATISGTIQYNGVLPQDPQTAVIVLNARRSGSAQFTRTSVRLPVANVSSWAWNQAKNNVTYELQAQLIVNGKEAAVSDMITATAPAEDEVLTFNVTKEAISMVAPSPIAVVNTASAATAPSATAVPAPALATLSGKVNFVGYAPAGATLIMQVRRADSNNFMTFSTLAAKDDVTWSWAGAEAGVLYTVKAGLIVNGQMVAESPDAAMAAPAVNQFVQIVSSVKPPAVVVTKPAAISGKIDLNGVIQNNSSVLVLVRKLGETNYTPVQRLSATDNKTWVFPTAVPGQWYELTAAYQVNENNVAVGNVVAVTAPANEQVIRINTGASIPAPSSSPSLLNCGTRQSDNKWPAVIQVPVVAQANEYWVQVGSQPGGSDVYNAKTNNSGSQALQITAPLVDNQSYYVRYAYAYCSDCGKETNYSGFSSSLNAKCP
jgi:hypothetical protein